MSEMRVAKRYARALFNTAQAQSIVPAVSEDLALVTDAIRSSEGMREFLVNPQTESSDKATLFEKTFGNHINVTTLTFIKLLIKKGRDEELTGVKLAYEELRRQSERVVKATIESSSELDQSQRDAIVTKIEKETGNKLESEFIVNPDLIMGVKVTYGDYVLDGSVRGQLNRMREALVYDLLKQA